MSPENLIERLRTILASHVQHWQGVREATNGDSVAAAVNRETAIAKVEAYQNALDTLNRLEKQ